jgi:hypothetical protein
MAADLFSFLNQKDRPGFPKRSLTSVRPEEPQVRLQRDLAVLSP